MLQGDKLELQLFLVYVNDSSDDLSINAKLFAEDSFRKNSQKLKEIPQNLREDFNADDVTSNDVIPSNQYRKEKKLNLSSIVIIDVKLASYLRKDLKFCFSFLWQEQLHSKI